jgi:hypothetical protein
MSLKTRILYINAVKTKNVELGSASVTLQVLYVCYFLNDCLENCNTYEKCVMDVIIVLKY